MFYVQKEIPPKIKVQGASGRANFGGTCITFRLSTGQREIDDLIASKHLQRNDSIQTNIFIGVDWSEMKNPEYYGTDADRTWSSLGTTVRMAVDRDNGVAFYTVFSP